MVLSPKTGTEGIVAGIEIWSIWLTFSLLCDFRPTWNWSCIYCFHTKSSCLSGKHFTKWATSSAPVVHPSAICSYLHKRPYAPGRKGLKEDNSKTFDSLSVAFFKRTQTSPHLSSGIINQFKSIHWLRGHNLCCCQIRYSSLCMLWNCSAQQTSKNLVVGAGMA